MKTLLFTLEYPPFLGGIANYYGNLAKYWPLEEEITILNNNDGQLDAGKGLLSWWPAYGELKRKLRSSKIDYVLVGHILPLGTVTYVLSLFRPLKYAVFLHGLDWTSALRYRRKRFLVRLIIKRADKIICANSYLAEKVKDFYPKGTEKISVVNPGIDSNPPEIDPQDLEKIKKEYELEDKVVLFSLGRLVERKGFDQVIKTLATLDSEYLDKIVYFIAGQGLAEDYLRKLIPSFLYSKINFLGSLSKYKKWLWLKQADIFLMPARDIDGDFEGFGIVYLEANLSSCPVIAGRSGGIKDAVIDNYSGLIVDPLSISELRKALIKLIDNPDLRKTLGEQGYQRARHDFNWEKQVKKLMEIIKD